MPDAPAPTVRRRLACALYEAVVLFGVALVPAALSTLALQWVPAGPWANLTAQVIGFACFGLYFTWMWSRSGQTLPMQTWRIRLVDASGQPPSAGRAALRYAAAWLWIAPAVVIGLALGWHRWTLLIAVLAWGGAYAALSLLRADRQFLHDVIAGTRLTGTLPAPPGPA